LPVCATTPERSHYALAPRARDNRPLLAIKASKSQLGCAAELFAALAPDGVARGPRACWARGCPGVSVSLVGSCLLLAGRHAHCKRRCHQWQRSPSRRKYATSRCAVSGSACNCRTQMASLRVAHSSPRAAMLICMERRQRFAAVSGTTAMPTPVSTFQRWFFSGLLLLGLYLTARSEV
jgi:hypothetical protein